MRKLAYAFILALASIAFIGCGGGGGNSDPVGNNYDYSDSTDGNITFGGDKTPVSGTDGNITFGGDSGSDDNTDGNPTPDIIGKYGKYAYDNKTSLAWVSSTAYTENNGRVTASNVGKYSAAEANNDNTALKTYESFCEELKFAGVESWRLPTSDEVIAFTGDLDAVNKVPFLLNRYLYAMISKDGETATLVTTYLAKKYKGFSKAGEKISWKDAVTGFGIVGNDGVARADFAVTCVRNGKPSN